LKIFFKKYFFARAKTKTHTKIFFWAVFRARALCHDFARNSQKIFLKIIFCAKNIFQKWFFKKNIFAKKNLKNHFLQLFEIPQKIFFASSRAAAPKLISYGFSSQCLQDIRRITGDSWTLSQHVRGRSILKKPQKPAWSRRCPPPWHATRVCVACAQRAHAQNAPCAFSECATQNMNAAPRWEKSNLGSTNKNAREAPIFIFTNPYYYPVLFFIFQKGQNAHFCCVLKTRKNAKVFFKNIFHFFKNEKKFKKISKMKKNFKKIK